MSRLATPAVRRGRGPYHLGDPVHALLRVVLPVPGLLPGSAVLQ